MDQFNGFLAGLQKNLAQTALSSTIESVKTDDEAEYIVTPSPNAIEWSVRTDFLGVDTIYHHRRQYQIIRDYFQLRCPLPSCNDQSEDARDCWDKGREYLESENLLVWNKSIGEDVCPKCGSTRTELVVDGLLKKYHTMHVIAGMRSGKTSVAAIMGTYMEHRILTVGHSKPEGLARFFKQLPKNPFEITFIASTDVQSADTIWAKFISLRSSSPWFERYVKWIKKLELEQTTPDGAKPWTYSEFDKQIINGKLNVKLNSLNSSASGIAGRTRIASFIDELARFENTDSRRSADEAYRVLDNSLRTLRSAIVTYPEIGRELPWLGSMLSISSPISDDDKAMRLLKQAPNIKSMYYGHYATWEFNPDQPREMFDEDFEKDPVGAMRDFGARPPTSASPLLVDPIGFRKLAVDPNLRPTANFKRILHIDKTGREYVSALVDSAILSRDGERYVACDAGQSFDQFAAACAHGEWVSTPEGQQLVTVYDWVFRLVPETNPRRDIWFDFLLSAIDTLAKFYHIARVDFDRWQSTFLIQQIRNRGIMCEMHGTTAEHFNKFLNDVNYSKVKMIPPLPEDDGLEPPYKSGPGVAFYELERLERSADMKKVSNPRKRTRRGYDSDDVAIVVAHVNWMVQSTYGDVTNSNSVTARLRREQSATGRWSSETAGGARLFRPPVNPRGW